MKKVMCAGGITVDIIIVPADSVPEPGTLRSVNGVTFHIGGCASNAATDLAKLGVPTSLACRIGKDMPGDYFLKLIKDAGVNTGSVSVREDSQTTVSVVCVATSGERSFLYSPGSSSEFDASDINEEMLFDSDIFFVAGAMLLTAFDGAPCEAVLKKAQEKGVYTVMDTSWDFTEKWDDKIFSCLKYLDLFMPSYDEAARLSGEEKVEDIAEFFINKGAKNVIIKVGKKGAYIREQSGESYYLPTYTKVKRVDTTGAGDSFCAGFIAGLAMDLPYKEAGKFANAVATTCVTAVGATTGIRTIEETYKFMEENKDNF